MDTHLQISAEHKSGKPQEPEGETSGPKGIPNKYKVVLPWHKTGQGTDPQVVAGGEGGRRRRRQAEKEAGLSLLTTFTQTNEELITRMENNLQQLKNELQNEPRNPSLGDTDKQLCICTYIRTYLGHWRRRQAEEAPHY